MPTTYTAEELITTVRNRTMTPDTSSLGTADADILRYLNEEFMTLVMPAVKKYREEYFVQTELIPTVASQDHYRIPKRAMGMSLRDVIYRSGTSRFSMANLSRTRLDAVSVGDTASVPLGFYTEGPYVVLLPAPSDSGDNLEISYYLRPGELVLSTAARTVTSVSGTQVTLSSAMPTSWTSSNTFDIHSEFSGAELKQEGLTVSSLGSNTITFVEAIDGSRFGTFQVDSGDWVCLEGEAALPAVPRELHVFLAQAASARLVEAMGDAEKLAMHTAELDRMLKRLPTLLEEVHGKPRIVTSFHSPLWRQSSVPTWISR